MMQPSYTKKSVKISPWEIKIVIIKKDAEIILHPLKFELVLFYFPIIL